MTSEGTRTWKERRDKDRSRIAIVDSIVDVRFSTDFFRKSTVHCEKCIRLLSHILTFLATSVFSVTFSTSHQMHVIAIAVLSVRLSVTLVIYT